MTETQRQPVPRDAGGELDTALAFLRLVAHVTVGERYWFGYHLIGSGSEDAEWEFDAHVPAGRSRAEVLQDYRDAISDILREQIDGTTGR